MTRAAVTHADAMADPLADLLDGVDRPHAGWSIGTFGAIAEFGCDPGEAVVARRFRGEHPGEYLGTSAVTARGGIRLRLAPGLSAIAYEGLSRHPDRWSQAVALCLPAADAAMARRTVLTEIGPDRDALRPEDRDPVLFDMGLGAPAIDFCIRTADPVLIAGLRVAAGRSVMESGSEAMRLIKLADPSPHRVVLSRAGRVEVFQPIPSRLKGDHHSPEGPHTHVLPDLLRHGRTHAATAPIPEGMVPVATLHPESPLVDALGRPKPFDPGCHASFQALVEAFAPAAYSLEKQRIAAAVRAGQDPDRYTPSETRLGRLAARVTLRQLGWSGEDLPVLAGYKARFDRTADAADDENAHVH